jgi:hypothetical protein
LECKISNWVRIFRISELLFIYQTTYAMSRAYLASAENLSSLSAGKAAFVRQTLQKLGGLHLKLAGKIVFAYASVLEIDFRRSRRGDESCAMRYPQKTASLIRMKYECARRRPTHSRGRNSRAAKCASRGGGAGRQRSSEPAEIYICAHS